MSKLGLLKFLVIRADMLLLGLLLFLLFLRIVFLHKSGMLKFICNICIGIIALGLFIQAAIYIDMRYIEPNWIQTDYLEVGNYKFPEDIKDLRIVQISDLHIHKFGFREKSLVNKLNALHPDIVLITGDFLSDKKALLPVLTTVSKIKANIGIFGVLGDIDYFAFRKEISQLKWALEKIGVRILDSENIKVHWRREDLQIVGFSGLPYNEYSFVRAFSGTDPRLPTIVIAHHQDITFSGFIKKTNTDLVLVGDTHGTQLGLKIIRSLSRYVSKFKYVSGLYHVNGVPLYVNRGIGTNTFGMRFFCRPEITVINLLPMSGDNETRSKLR